MIMDYIDGTLSYDPYLEGFKLNGTPNVNQHVLGVLQVVFPACVFSLRMYDVGSSRVFLDVSVPYAESYRLIGWVDVVKGFGIQHDPKRLQNIISDVENLLRDTIWEDEEDEEDEE